MPVLIAESTKIQYLLRILLGVSCAILLIFYLLPSPLARPELFLLMAAWFLWLYTLVGRWSVHTIANLALVAGLAQMVSETLSTGGVNSPLLIWFSVIPVLGLTLVGSRKGNYWLALCLLVVLALYVGTQMDWIDGQLKQTPVSVVWAYLSTLSALLLLQFIVNIYDRLNQRQMQELQNHSQALAQTQQELLQSQTHKDDFIASMGHELRTPMNAILGLNGMLQEQLSDEPDNLQLAKLIRCSTEQLLELVNNILLLSQLEAQRVLLKPQAVNVRQMLQSLQALWQAPAQAKGLQLIVQCEDSLPQWLALDAPRLEQVFHQLLENAIKFTPQGQVSVRAFARQGELILQVKDSGPGIAADKLGKIFDRFEQADPNTNRSHGGTGIGLSIAKLLVELHQGQLRLHSVQGQGACFEMCLPLRESQDPSQASDRALLPLQRQDLRVLVIDDNPVNLQLIDLALKQLWPQGQFVGVNSGEVALQWLAQHSVDVVLLDRVMPGMDGMETARHIRASDTPAVAQLPIVGLTAFDDDTEFAHCLQAGMDAVASKPISAQPLKDLIEKVLVQRQTQAASQTFAPVPAPAVAPAVAPDEPAASPARAAPPSAPPQAAAPESSP